MPTHTHSQTGLLTFCLQILDELSLEAHGIEDMPREGQLTLSLPLGTFSLSLEVHVHFVLFRSVLSLPVLHLPHLLVVPFSDGLASATYRYGWRTSLCWARMSSSTMSCTSTGPTCCLTNASPTPCLIRASSCSAGGGGDEQDVLEPGQLPQEEVAGLRRRGWNHSLGPCEIRYA